ncbi:O-antigen ligase family protein [Sphingomonas arenae]|uniref:O-antigen ligase family protein n=1 Tax=Sphingomonas arenae TaxID=2812555 RepID=UPI0019687AA3|nr:O-antigen ligase family protein [Sphingomonas arenae]
MKWIFILFLLGFTPALAAYLRGQPRYLPHACFAMAGMLFFLDPYLYVAPVSWPAWPGPVKGVEVSLIDGVAIAIIAATQGRARTPLLLKIGIAIFGTALVVSIFAGQQKWPSFFYAWQVLRAVLVYVAVSRAAAADERVPIAILSGLAVGVFINCLTAVQQFLGGDIQAGGRMGHQNLLGMMTHFAVMPAFALLLGGRRTLLAAAIVAAGAVIAIVGGSRATIGLFGLGLVVTTLLSMRNHMTGRKGVFAGVAVATLVLAAPVMMWAVDRRSEASKASSNQERQAFINAAKMMIADHPLGVGGNQYVLVANIGGYSGRAGVAWNAGNRAAPVHNLYYLTTAELGYLGLAGLLTIIVALVQYGLASLRRVSGERADFAVGATAVMIVVAAHSYYEYITVTFYVQYLLGMMAGILVGVTSAVTGRKATPVHAPLVPPASRDVTAPPPVPVNSPLY